MCLIYSNSVADNGFGKIGTKDKARYEKKLARLASEDDVNTPDGLWGVIGHQSIRHFAKIDQLKEVRKFKAGRHRIYIIGRYTECRYIVCFVMPFKKVEDDEPKTPEFQDMMLKALKDKKLRLLPVLVEDEDDGDT